ncbi:MAG: bifunctional diaminohydroxyphosphoribosylaminopyrimidine deaminase/5-amino-6-(5-phosphoribosylamino)uracil reductase RibD, partial [Bacteroidales bacterium]|nr:bifunctional diaminohydroxyphosphoribosylaminopyrimidine deaminase/5-amino-6-(5-phosphoribosylamino)uracil reductase RibD [Bacteroidales bacterium]
MHRCLDLAMMAEGRTYPNPLVGSVIVYDGKIIGEGYHVRAGDRHAEVVAIDSVKDKEKLRESTLYVNLEPCSHYGKTPPCADLIVEKGIKKVVVGTVDTSSKVSGRGILKLRKSGCEVLTGVHEASCRWLNRRFFTFHEKKRPYVILKWAQSSDGFLDAERNPGDECSPRWITGEAERVLVHRWRASEQSILAGAGTLRADNPQLNVRCWSGKDPIRLILSSSGRLDPGLALFNTSGSNIIFTHNENVSIPDAMIKKLEKNQESAKQVLQFLYQSDIQSVFVEGGSEVLNHFIDTGLWDEA